MVERLHFLLLFHLDLVHRRWMVVSMSHFVVEMVPNVVLLHGW